MNTHLITALPPVGIVYALAGVCCAVWAIRRKTGRIPWSLSGLILSIAVLNAYVEEWPALKRFGFWYGVPVLVVLFLLPYRSLCLRLIERTGIRLALAKEQYSFLPVVYVGLVAVTVIAPFFARDENPAYVLFALIVFVCALHVPMFAFGRSKIASFLVKSGLAASKAVPDISWDFLGTVMAILGIPLVLTLIVQAVVRDDYRLFAVDAVLTAIIFSLLMIFRRGGFSEHPSEPQANHGSGKGQVRPARSGLRAWQYGPQDGRHGRGCRVRGGDWGRYGDRRKGATSMRRTHCAVRPHGVRGED